MATATSYAPVSPQNLTWKHKEWLMASKEEEIVHIVFENLEKNTRIKGEMHSHNAPNGHCEPNDCCKREFIFNPGCIASRSNMGVFYILLFFFVTSCHNGTAMSINEKPDINADGVRHSKDSHF
jgi:hypothetical protein